MIVADSSVLIGHLNDAMTPEVQRLRAIVGSGELLVYSDVSLLEVLQGARGERDVSRLEKALAPWPMMPTRSPDDFRAAARLYRDARRRGLTIRSSIDCLMAAACIRLDAELLHRDIDFVRLATVSNLRLAAV